MVITWRYATMKGNDISISPYFSGTDPSEVKSDKYAGLRVLSKERRLWIYAASYVEYFQKKSYLKQETQEILSQARNGPSENRSILWASPFR